MLTQDEFDIFRDKPVKSKKMPEITSKSIDVVPNLESLPEKPLLLVVDDDINVREALKLILGKKYQLVVCANGSEAIEQTHLPFYAVILDIKMEGKNGFETFLEIKKKKIYIPIIFHSAYQDLKDPYEIMNDYRPFGYVIKEGDTKKLLDTIESAVQYYHQLNENSILIKQLEKSKRSYKDLVENSLDIIFSLDENWNILSVNQAITQILRYPVQEILNTNILNLTFSSHEATGEILENKLQELSLSNNVLSFNCDFVTKFGEPKEMHLKLRYVLQENGFTIFGTASTIEEDLLIRICESESQVYKLGNYLTHVDIVSQRIANYASKYCSSEVFMNLKLCIRELIINAMEHGNLGISFDEKSESLVTGNYINLLLERQKNPTHANRRITVEYFLSPKKIEVTITDEGNGFDHAKMLARSINENENQILGHGRGIAMAKLFLDSITYNEKGNSVSIVKNF